MREVEHDEVSYLIWKLGLVAEHQSVLASATDTSFFFGTRDLLPTLLSTALEAGHARSLHALIGAAQQPLPLLRRAHAAGVALPFAAFPVPRGGDAPSTWPAWYLRHLREVLATLVRALRPPARPLPLDIAPP